MVRAIKIFFVLLIVIFFSKSNFAATIIDANEYTTYCTDYGTDLFIATAPPNKHWWCDVPGAMTELGEVNHNEWHGVFDPTAVSGPYPRAVIIRYSQNADGSGTSYWEVTVTVDEYTGVAPTFDPVPDICVTAVAIDLEPYVNPTPGTFSGSGISGNDFDPSVAGIGTHTIEYAYPAVGCASVVSRDIIVNNGPAVALGAFADVCEDAASFVLSGGSPAGGTYYINGVVNGTFDPAAEGDGVHVIDYEYSDGSCSNTATQNLTVNVLPTPTISNLKTEQCDTEVDYLITGNPTDAGGVWTYSGAALGLVDNGNGTATFKPNSTGLGTHNVTYTYTDANGCSAFSSQSSRVGTELFFINLDANYCENEGNFTFQYTPGVSANPGGYSLVVAPATAAFIDNADGTADFNPSTAGADTYTFTYEFWDVIGCKNILEQDVTVTPMPNATIGGLIENYCSNDADDPFTGSPAPLGASTGVFSSTVAGLTDNTDGTAVFSPSVAPIGAGSITYTYTDAVGCVGTDTKPVDVTQSPSVTISGNATICEGDATDLTFTFSDNTNYSVDYTDGSNTFSFSVLATNSTTQSVSPVVNTTYTIVSVTDDVTACSGIGVGSATITVTPQVAITTNPVDKTACPADNVSFNVVASGADLSYAWEFNDGGGFVPVGINSASLAINGVDALDVGNYHVIVSSSCGGPLTSSDVAMTVGTTTSITLQPTDEHKCDGNSVNFTITADGDNLTYTWRKDGVDVFSGSNIFNLSGLDNTDVATYTCFVSGDCGNELSNPASLLVDDPIVINTQPINKDACPGSNVNFTVDASGTNLSFQWEVNDGGGYVDVLGATSQNLIINGVTLLGHDGNLYKCKITSPCGDQLYSDEVTLSILTLVSISDQPDDITVCENNPVNFQVVASGSIISYQWQRNGVDLANLAGVIDGATGNSLTLHTPVLADAGLYRCVITGNCNVINSDVATLTVDQAAVITTDPANVDACETDDVNFSVVATGTNLIYEWFDDTDVSQGVFATNFGISNVVKGTHDKGYYCAVSNGCGVVYSAIAQLVISDLTVLNPAFPTDNSKCIGNNANFTVDVTQGTISSYKWQFDDLLGGGYIDLVEDGVHIIGSNTNNLSVNTLIAGDAGLYRCVVTGICGTINSNAATLDIDEPVAITVNPTDKLACEFDDVNYTITATGTTLSYQWANSGGNILGAVNPLLVLSAVDALDEDDYYCVVSNSCNSETSALANLTLYNEIIVTADPTSIIRCEGDDAAFNITATGDNMTFQWLQDGIPLFNGVNANGATVSGVASNSLLVSGITLGEDGVYTCDVDGPCNTESRSATLTVDELIVINTNPANKTICPGNTSSFIVNVSGLVTSYKWQFDDLSGGGFVDLVNGVNFSGGGTFSGVDGTTLTITDIQNAEKGIYRCEITGSCNVAYSNSANLSVPITTLITAQPSDVTGCEGQDISFTVAADGASLSYEWYKNPAVLQVDGGDISGATSNTLSIANIDVSDAGVYYCKVIGTCGTELSGNPTLTVNEGLTINTNPISKTRCLGGTASYVVDVSGTINSYQWEFNNGGGFVVLLADANTLGTTTNTLTLNNINAADEGTYRCVVDGVCEDLNSNPAGLTIGVTTAITTQPFDVTSCVGDDVDLSVSANGTSLNYQWYKNGNLIAGATLNTLSFVGVVVGDEDVYDCDISGTCGTETSDPANLTVNEYITFTAQPTNKSRCPNGTVTFSVATSGSIVSYAWFKDGVDISTIPDTDFINEDSPTLTIINLDLVDHAGNYTCQIIGDCETRSSNAATLTIGIVTASTDPADVTACEGETVNYFVSTSGSNLSYQWYKGGAIFLFNGLQASGATISGATNLTLTIEDITTSDDDIYYCVVSGDCDDVTTNNASLTVTPNTTITLQPVNFSVVDGGNATFTITADGDIASYLWYKDGNSLANGGNISGADSPTLVIDPVAFGVDDGNYHCVVTGNTCGNANTNPATLTINPTTVIITQPLANVTKCEGEDLLLTVVLTGGAHTFEWRKGGVPLINGAQASGSVASGVSTSTLNIVGLFTDDAGAYTCYIDGTESTNPSVVTVIESITINTHPADKERCMGDPLTFSINASGGIDQYQWKKNGVDIAGENASTYSIVAVVAGDAATYTCTVEALSTCSDVPSNPAQLIVNEITNLISGPVDELLCEGNSTTLTADVAGSNLTFQWYLNSNPLADGGSISGSQEKDLVINNALVTDDGDYYCEIQASCGNTSTVPVEITIDPATLITTQPISRSKCIGSQVLFTVAADGLSLSYQWYHNGVLLGGETNPSITVDPIVAGDAGNYYCEITSGNGCGDITSNAATLTVYDNTVLNASPVDETLCEGESTTLTADVSGGNLIYIWKKDNLALVNGTNISGVDTKDLVISNATLTEDGIYQCDISGFCGAAVSTNPATIIIDPSTNITSHPIGEELCVGDSKLFIVIADGLDIAYQWRLDGVNIGGEISSQLNLDPIIIGDNGTYTCLVSSNNGCGDVISNSAVLTVNELTTINTHPLDRTICQGFNTTFTVDAIGGDLQYQWVKDGVTTLSDGGNISGSETKDLQITGVQLSDDGVYTCNITGTCNDQTSNPARLTVNATTIINSHPASISKCENESIIFYVSATGVNIGYQWQKDGVNLIDGLQASGSTVSNALTSSVTISGLDILDAGAYRCVVTGDCTNKNSNPANLTIYINTLITTQPVNVNICENETAVFTTQADGSNLTYQWKLNGNAISDTGSFSGSQTNELTVLNAPLSYVGTYTCVVSGSCGSGVISDLAQLTIDENIEIIVQPVSKGVNLADNFSLSVFANGDITNYQWQKDGVNINNPTASGATATGITSSLLTISGVGLADAGAYRCVVTGLCDEKNSEAANIEIYEETQITSSPSDANKCVGNSATFSITATGSDLGYQWIKDGANLSNGAIISGANSPTLSISSVALSDAGSYYCYVTGNFGNSTSAVATLTINDIISFTTHPESKTKCESDDVFFSVVATGAATYRWYEGTTALNDAGNFSGAFTNTLHISNIVAGDAGVYKCEIVGTCGTLFSNTASLTVTSPISLTDPVSLTRCTGQTANFSVTATGTVSSFQWYKDGDSVVNNSRISGSNSPTLVIDDIIISDDGVYSCTVIGNCGAVTSSFATLSVNESILINVQPSNVTECEGEDAYFEIDASGTSLSYTWYKDGAVLPNGGNINGALSSFLIVSDISSADAGIYQCEISTASCGIVNSNPASLSVDLLPEDPGVISGDNVMCQGSVNLIFEVPEVTNATEYEWILPYGATIIGDQTSRLVEINFANDANSGIIQVYGKNDCGLSSTPSSHNITVNALPISNSGLDKGVCAYETTLDGNIVANGMWTKLGGSAVIDNPTQNNSDVTTLSQGDNKFVWTVTENGCVSRDTVIITCKKITVDAGVDQRICDTKTYLDGSDPGVGNGQWSVVTNSAYFDSIYDPTTLVYGLFRGDNVVKWTVTVNGCESSDTVTISNDLPTYANAGIDQSFIGTSTTLEGNDPEKGTGFWTLIYGSGTIVNPLLFNTDVNNLNPGENKFRWTITNNDCSSSDDVLIINETPTIVSAGDDQTICSKNTTLDAAQPAFGYGEWIVYSGAATFEDNTQHDSRVFDLGYGQNILIWKVTEVSVTSDTVVITNSLPTTANAGPDRVICADSALLQGNIINIGDGYWSLIGGSAVFNDSSKYNTMVSNLGLGSNTLRWTSTNGGCSLSDEVIITNNNPTTAYAGVDQVLCSDSAVLYNNEPSIGTGAWSIYSGAGTFDYSVVKNLAQGTNILLWTITNDQCKSVDTVSITNNSPSVANAGGDMIICVDSVNLSANFPFVGTGVWSIISGSGLLQDSSINNTLVESLSLGTNVLKWEITNNGCVSSDEIVISYDLIQAIAGVDQPICSDNTVLNANNPSPGTGQWSVVGGAGSAQFLFSTEPNTTVSGLEQGQNILRWTITNNGCITSDDVILKNNTPTAAYAGADQDICTNETNITANNPNYGIGEWSVIGGSANIADSTSSITDISNLAYGANTLRWTVTNESCISTDEVVVNNNMPSDAFAGEDLTLCADSTIMRANTPTYGDGEWSIIQGTGTFQLSNYSNTKIAGLAYGNNNFVWTIIKSGCVSTDTVQIINDLPATPDAGPDQTLCSSSVVMSANNPGTLGIGEWIRINGAATISEEDKNNPNASITDLGLGANTLRWRITNNACSLNDDVVIYNNMPSTSNAGIDQDICGDSTYLQANIPVVGSGYWSVTGGYAEIESPSSNNTKIRTLGYDDNYIKWTITNGQCVSYDIVKITNNLSFVFAGDDQEVYEPQTKLVANNPGDNSIGQWIVTSGNGIFENDSSFETQVNELGSGVNTFTWTIAKNGCVVSDDIVITYFVLPIPIFGISETKGCPPFTVELVNESIGGDKFEWDLGDGNDTITSGTFTHTYVNHGSYKVQLTAYGYADIPVVVDTLVNVYQMPVADFNYAPDTIYIPGQFLSCINSSQGSDKFLWYFDDGLTDTAKNPAHVYETEGDYRVMLLALTVNSCVDSIWKMIHVEELAVVDFPTGFTPDPNGASDGSYGPNDLSNNIFYPNIEGDIYNYRLEIYNRWGVLLFESNKIEIGWDGYYKGEMLKEGAYVWKVSGILNNRKPFVKAGTIILIRNP